MNRLATEDIIAVVHERLRTHYGPIGLVSGQGIAKGQRVEFEDGGRLRCVIKTSSGGRISFGRRDDGTWSGLSECDRVVIVAPARRHSDDLTISMFDRQVLVNAFEANLAAQKKAGMGHIPCWLAPFHEEDRGVRGTGDGFGDKALWREPFSMAPSVPTLGPSGRTDTVKGGPARGLTLAEAKEGLARTFGVSPDAIEITIRG